MPPLDRLDDERRDVPLGAARASRRVEVAERDPRAAGQQRPEALLEELVADERQRPERDAVEARCRTRAAAAARSPRARTSSPSPPPRRRCSRRTPRRARRQPLGERLGEHPGQRRVVDLHAVDEVGGERRLQHLAHVGMVVAEAGEALAGVEVEVRAARRRRRGRSPARTRTRLSKPRIRSTSTSDGSRWRAASVERLVGARERVGDDAEGVGWRSVVVHGDRRATIRERVHPQAHPP